MSMNDPIEANPTSADEPTGGETKPEASIPAGEGGSGDQPKPEGDQKPADEAEKVNPESGGAVSPLLSIEGRDLYTVESVVEFAKKQKGDNGNLAGEVEKLKAELSKLQQANPAATAPAAEADDEIDPFLKQRGYVKESEVRKILEEERSKLLTEISEQQRQAAIEQQLPSATRQLNEIRAKYPDFREYEPMIQEMLSSEDNVKLTLKLMGKESLRETTYEDFYQTLKQVRERNLKNPNKPIDSSAISKPIPQTSGNSPRREQIDSGSSLGDKLWKMAGLE